MGKKKSYLPKCLITEATTLPRDVLKTRIELSQMPPAYKYLPSELTANRFEHKLTAGWNGPTMRFRFLNNNFDINKTALYCGQE